MYVINFDKKEQKYDKKRVNKTGENGKTKSVISKFIKCDFFKKKKTKIHVLHAGVFYFFVDDNSK